jgi:exosome complex exonuclease DIS3/RRP44
MALEGYELDYTSSKTLANSLDQINRTGDPFFNKLVRIMTTRCMHEAIYFCSADFNPQEYRHYGLAASVYTHFTSPIRRYADVLVHRLLSAALGIESLSPVLSTKSKLVRVCD